MKFGKTEKSASLILGAAAGAVAMYLLDPKQGQARRDRIASAASDHLHNLKDSAQAVASSAVAYGQQAAATAVDLGNRATSHIANHVDAAHAAVHDTLDAAHSAIHSGIDAARDEHWGDSDRVARVKALVDQAYAAARGTANDASAQGHSIFTQATETLSNLWSKYNPTHLASHLKSAVGDRVDAARNSARSQANDAQDRGSQWVKAARVRTALKLAPELSSGGVVLPVAASAVVCGLAGVGAMYFLDPERGADRRAIAMDQARNTVQRTGVFFRASGREIGDRLRGIQRQGKSLYQDTLSSLNYSSGDQLITAIRSALDSVVPEARLLHLQADSAGRVTVSGLVPSADREKVINAVVAVTGVTEVVNRLETSPASASSLSTSSGNEPASATGKPQGAGF